MNEEYVGSILQWTCFSKKLRNKLSKKNEISIADEVDLDKTDLKNKFEFDENLSLEENFEEIKYENEEEFYHELKYFFENLESILERINKKQPKGYLIQAATYSCYGSICHNGQCGYALTNDLMTMVAGDEINKIFLEKTKRGNILHVVSSNHDCTYDCTLKVINFDCDDTEQALQRLKIVDNEGKQNNNKFLPTPIPFTKEFLSFL